MKIISLEEVTVPRGIYTWKIFSCENEVGFTYENMTHMTIFPLVLQEESRETLYTSNLYDNTTVIGKQISHNFG